MTEYIFNTTATMKEYNNKKWWIASDIIPRKRIAAETLAEALTLYREAAEERHGIEISKTALKNKRPMYIDTKDGVKQTGYVITGKTEFRDDDRYTWSAQYIDLWIEILTIVDTEF